MLRAGAPWSALPRQDGILRTCWCRLKRWETIGMPLKLRKVVVMFGAG